MVIIYLTIFLLYYTIQMYFLRKAKKTLVKKWLIHIKLIGAIVVAVSTFGAERIGESMVNNNTIIEKTIETENTNSESTVTCTCFSSSKENIL